MRTNLPSPTTELIGRDDELAVLLDLLGSARLVTVSGPGGAGKTRLALEVAQRAAEGFGGVWFVALEQVPDPNDVVGAVSRVMGLPEPAGVDAGERLLTHLRDRRVLLVLDNLDHLLDAASLVGHIARSGPDVRVLVTSQEPLRVGGEHVLGLDPLPLPTGSERGLPELLTVPSVALLVERAAAAGTGFALTEENRFDVARLCGRLDGMPLALELAAPRLGTLDPRALDRRLEEGLEALAGDGSDLPVRQRGLRALLEFSVGLLSDAERDLLLRLSVFAAGFTADLAQAAFGDVAQGLDALVEAGLVRPGDGERYEVPPPVRRFGAEQIDAQEEGAAHAAIIDALVALAEPFEQRWVVAAGEGWLTLDPEAGNIFAELDWSSLMDYGRHAALAAATGWWMTHSGAAEYSRDHLEIALARTTDPRMLARCLQALGTLGQHDSDPSACLDAADAWHYLDDVDGEFYSAICAADLYGAAQEGEAAMDVVERCAALAAMTPEDGDKQWILATVRAEARSLLGHPDEGLAALEPWLGHAPPGSWQQFRIAARVADLELVLHRFGDALANYGAAMAMLEPLGSALGLIQLATTAAVALLHLGRVDEAAITWAVCELGYAELSWEPSGAPGEWFQAMRASLDEDRQVAGRERAGGLGMDGGLAWVGQVARGETAAG